MSHRITIGFLAFAALAGGAGVSGCAGHAQVELAAADAIESLAGETQKALDEFARDLGEADAERGRDIASAFAARARRDHADDEQMARNEAAFTTALERLWADRETALRRHGRASANVGLLRETAAGLRRMGVDSLRLEDEARRYVESLLEARARAAVGPDEGGAAAADGSN
jgi:hypothetical protein